jgi:hypothetical protein
MKRVLLFLSVIAAVGTLGATFLTHAQEKAASRFEYAIVKWDGPDRLYFNMPERFEMMHLAQQGVTIPKEAENEEFCLAAACNIMAKSGWEPLNLDSRRVVFRRATGK